ncbi:hypothetical protein D3C84_1110350 [compost metagenome]
MGGDDELQVGGTGLDQPCQIDRQFDEMVLIQRTHRVINEYILQLIKLPRFAVFQLWHIACANDLIK